MATVGVSVPSLGPSRSVDGRGGTEVEDDDEDDEALRGTRRLTITRLFGRALVWRC